MNGILANIAIRAANNAATDGGASGMVETVLQRKPSGSKGGILYTPPAFATMNATAQAAQRCAEKLLSRGETVAVAESSSGGKAAAALVEVAGASKFFGDGVICYSKASKARVLALTDAQQAAARSATEPHALMLAEAVRSVNGTDWGVGETGVAGPGPSARGVNAGEGCVAVVGPDGYRASATLSGGSGANGNDVRGNNMDRFAAGALGLLAAALER